MCLRSAAAVLALAAVLVLAATLVPAHPAAAAEPIAATGGWVTTIHRAPLIVARPPGATPAPYRTTTATAPPRSWSTSMIVTASLPPPAGKAERAHGLTGAHDLDGMASYYWQFPITANGEKYDPHTLTAAHKTLPFNTSVRVTNLANGRQVIVRINNRGPYKPGRVIDLSLAAAEALDMTSRGIVPVKLEVVR